MLNRASASLVLVASLLAAGCSSPAAPEDGAVPEKGGPKAVVNLEARAGSAL